MPRILPSSVRTAAHGALSVCAMRSQRRRNRLDAVAMTHPHPMLLAFEALEQRILRIDLQRCGTVFLRVAGGVFAPRCVATTYMP